MFEECLQVDIIWKFVNRFDKKYCNIILELRNPDMTYE